MHLEKISSRSVLVTGGAGYIGSHVCKHLAENGYEPVAYDDLSNGHPRFVKWGPLIRADIADSIALRRAIQDYQISAIFHFAASAYVAESVSNPRKYFGNNVVKSIALLDMALDMGVPYFVFSSSCATYGLPKSLPITESQCQHPMNPYGDSKMTIERVLAAYGQAYGLKYVSLRYFNVSGADSECEIGESHRAETHLIPLAILSTYPDEAPLQVLGADYPTQDGTAIRDYVHVSDVASAHLLALNYLRFSGKSDNLNLGTGTGYSVYEIISAVESVTGRRVKRIGRPRRVGDPAELVADPSRAMRLLSWEPRRSDLLTIVESASKWIAKQRANEVASFFEASTSV